MTWIAPIPDPAAEREGLFESVPAHIAIIMDGNGRWAQQRGQQRIKGHWEGANRVDDITTECARLGVSYLTLYAFSTENWNRPQTEVNMLMHILVHYLKSMQKKLIKNRITLIAQGELERLPEKARKQLYATMQATKTPTPRMYLNLSLSYGARSEIATAAQRISEKVLAGELKAENVDENTIASHLYQPHLPDPDLLIRSGGESRLSNFLLWQAAYSEIYVTDTLWPNFDEEALYQSIEYFSKRERRFGLTSEQITSEGDPPSAIL